MAADEPGQDDLPGAFHRISAWKALPHLITLTHCNHPFPFGDDGCIPQDPVSIPEGDYNSVFEASSHIHPFVSNVLSALRVLRCCGSAC